MNGEIVYRFSGFDPAVKPQGDTVTNNGLIYLLELQNLPLITLTKLFYLIAGLFGIGSASAALEKGY